MMGEQALMRAIENAEDDIAAAAAAVERHAIGHEDVVIGLAASGSTPFTLAVLREAARRGALTIGVANTAGAPLLALAEHLIAVLTGAEPIAGSTRMQAGTAQKVVLNLFSTAVMVKLGRVYRGLMVHMRARNAKLRRRAEMIVAEIVGCTASDAARFIERSDGDVKLAVLLGFGLGPTAAATALARHEGNLRKAIDEIACDQG